MPAFIEVEQLFIQDDRKILQNRKKQRKTSSARYIDNYKRRKVHKLYISSNIVVTSLRQYRILGHYVAYSNIMVSCFRTCLKSKRKQYFTFSIVSHMFDNIVLKTHDLLDFIEKEDYSQRYTVIVKIQPNVGTCLYFRTLARYSRKKYFCALRMLADLYIDYSVVVLNYISEIKEISFYISINQEE